MIQSIRCAIYRGGTSRGLMLHEALLPPPGRARDRMLISLMGGPDPKQIDGLGGGLVVTSKAALIGPSRRAGVDIDYTFAQIVVGQDKVDYQANCGNISSAVGPFAIESGLIAARDGATPVTIYNTNTNKTIVALIPTPGGKVTYEGDFVLSGVQGTGAKIELKFLDPGGAATGKILPTGSPRDRLTVPGLGEVDISVVDASNLFIFVRAADLGLRGNETPQELDANQTALDYLETIRGMVAQKLGYAADYRRAAVTSPTVPKIMAVAGPAGDIDLHVRMMSMQKTHKTLAMTGGMCVAAGCVIPGTILHELMSAHAGFRSEQIAIAHPSGRIAVGVDAVCAEGAVTIRSTSGFRTARPLMEGAAYYRLDD